VEMGLGTAGQLPLFKGLEGSARGVSVSPPGLAISLLEDDARLEDESRHCSQGGPSRLSPPGLATRCVCCGPTHVTILGTGT
jgi:hypothetical protein